MDAQGQRPGQRTDQVGAPTLFQCNDRLTARAGVGTQGEHRNARVRSGQHHVRLIGYDNIKQSQGANMIVHRAPIAA